MHTETAFDAALDNATHAALAAFGITVGTDAAKIAIAEALNDRIENFMQDEVDRENFTFSGAADSSLRLAPISRSETDKAIELASDRIYAAFGLPDEEWRQSAGYTIADEVDSWFGEKLVHKDYYTENKAARAEEEPGF